MMHTVLAWALSAAIGVTALAQDYDQLSKQCYENGDPDQR